MVFRTKLTYTLFLKILVMKNIDSSTTGYILEPGKYEISDINFLLKSSLPDNVEVIITIDHNRLK